MCTGLEGQKGKMFYCKWSTLESPMIKWLFIISFIFLAIMFSDLSLFSVLSFSYLTCCMKKVDPFWGLEDVWNFFLCCDFHNPRLHILFPDPICYFSAAWPLSEKFFSSEGVADIFLNWLCTIDIFLKNLHAVSDARCLGQPYMPKKEPSFSANMVFVCLETSHWLIAFSMREK